MSFLTILYFFPLCGQTQARDLLPGEERTIIVKIEDHTGGTISSEGKYNLVQVKKVTILVICCAAWIKCRYYEVNLVILGILNQEMNIKE